MLYSLFRTLSESGCDVPGGRLMSYITFRSGAAFVLALLIAIFIGRRIIDRLKSHQIGEDVRNLGIEGEKAKKGTPTMGGIIIIISIIVPCLLVGNLGNVYMILLLAATLWLGAIGLLDDWLKLKYHNKDGIKGKYKIIGQVGIGVIVAATMYLNPDMVIVKNQEVQNRVSGEIENVIYSEQEVHTPETTIPFVKNNNFNYSWLTSWMGSYAETGGWIAFLLITIFLVTATSNGANLNDGLDGLCTGVSAVNGVALAIMAYLGGNVIYSSYLNIMYIPGSEEMVVYMMAFIGALVGFLWYNASPAQVFMGDTGSLMLGGVIAVFAILIHKELLLPVLCAIFYIEDLSVIIQTAYFKATGGRRVFKTAPIHHHFQKDAGVIDALIQAPAKAIPEQKIVTRFWIVAIILAVLTFVTLKIR
ncbi:MAG: phospho-N-acetylmuramoyl-pentapeptide-transferase [Muribaculaceae bacterium]